MESSMFSDLPAQYPDECAHVIEDIAGWLAPVAPLRMVRAPERYIVPRGLSSLSKLREQHPDKVSHPFSDMTGAAWRKYDWTGAAWRKVA